MDQRQFSLGELQDLLSKAQGCPSEVTERLQWFIHFAKTGSVSSTCRHFGIARTTFYRWANRYDPSDLKLLEDIPTLIPGEAQSDAVLPNGASPVHVHFTAPQVSPPAPHAPVQQAHIPSHQSALAFSVVINVLLTAAVLGAMAFLWMGDRESSQASAEPKMITECRQLLHTPVDEDADDASRRQQDIARNACIELIHAYQTNTSASDSRP